MFVCLFFKESIYFFLKLGKVAVTQHQYFTKSESADRQNTNLLQIVPCLEMKLQTPCTIMSPNTRIVSKHCYGITEFNFIHASVELTVGYAHSGIRAEHGISKVVLGIVGYPWFVIAISKMELTIVIHGFKRSPSMQ